jgi:hypothetical protein
MEKTFKPNWLPALTGGLLVGGAILIPVSEGIRDAIDVCGFLRPVVACQPAILPPADMPHPDHAPASPWTIATTATSTSTTTLSPTTVTPTGR